MEVVDAATGEIRGAEIFVAVLGASSFIYAEATWSQALPDWIAAHVNALAVLSGVPRQIVSDNLKSGITKACFFEPTVNRTYSDMAMHYGTAIIPARPYKPPDKAKSRGRRAGCAALDSGEAAQPPLLLPGRTEWRHPRAGC
jgi:transposase